MQRLIEGVHRFQRETFGNSRELFNRPSRNGQQPLTLLITCADAGLLAEHISPNRPDGFHCANGELFAYEPATGQFEPMMAFGEGRNT